MKGAMRSHDKTSNKYLVIMDQRMKQCEIATKKAVQDIPATIDPLRVVLKLPNTVRLLVNISKVIQRNLLVAAMLTWQRFSRLRTMRRYGSLKKIQKSWKEASSYKLEKSLKLEAELAKQRLIQKSAISIQKFARMKVWSMRLLQRHSERRYKNAVKIQQLFRGFCVRGFVINEIRKQLVHLLREWAQGSSERLLNNPYLSDYHSKALVNHAISLSVVPSKPIRNYPALYTLKSCIANVKKRMTELQELHKEEYREYLRMVDERMDFEAEDYRSTMYEKFLAGCEKRRQDELEKERQKVLREKMEFVRRIKRRAEELKSMSAEQQAQIEKSEREKMFREEYTIRRYYDILKARKKRLDECNWEVMSAEDELGRALRAAERRDAEWIQAVDKQVQLAVKARNLDMTQYSTLTSKSDLAVDSVRGTLPSSPDSESTMRKWKEAAISKHFNVWNDSLSIPTLAKTAGIRIRAGLRVFDEVANLANGVRADKGKIQPNTTSASASALATAHFQVDSRNVSRMRVISNYRRAKQKRLQTFAVLVNNIILFEHKHFKLVDARDLYRHKKFSSRQERQSLLQQAAALESELLGYESRALVAFADLQLQVQEEVALFAQVFLSHESDPCLDADQDDAEEEKKAQDELNAIALAASARPNSGVDDSSQSESEAKPGHRKIGSRGDPRQQQSKGSKGGRKKPRVIASSNPEADAMGIAAKKVLARQTYVKKNHQRRTPTTASAEPIADESRDYWQAFASLGLLCAPPPLPPPPPPRYLQKKVVYVAPCPEQLIQPLTIGQELYRPGQSPKRLLAANVPEVPVSPTKAIGPSTVAGKKEQSRSGGTPPPKRGRSNPSKPVPSTPTAKTATTATTATTTTSTNSAAISLTMASPSGDREDSNNFVQHAFQMPGLNHFVHDSPVDVDFVIYGYEFIEWIKKIVHWFEIHEKHWRLCHELHILSFLQKMYWLISSAVDDNPKECISEHLEAAVDSNQTAGRLFGMAMHMDVADCAELLLYRSDIEIKAQLVDHSLFPQEASQPYLLRISSGNCDKHLGLHPASLCGMCILLAKAMDDSKDAKVGMKRIVLGIIDIIRRQKATNSKVSVTPAKLAKPWVAPNKGKAKNALPWKSARVSAVASVVTPFLASAINASTEGNQKVWPPLMEILKTVLMFEHTCIREMCSKLFECHLISLQQLCNEACVRAIRTQTPVPIQEPLLVVKPAVHVDNSSEIHSSSTSSTAFAKKHQRRLNGGVFKAKADTPTPDNAPSVESPGPQHTVTSKPTETLIARTYGETDSELAGLALRAALKNIRTASPLDFIRLQSNFIVWNVEVPRWMFPVFRAGTRPKPEPFWRRLDYEIRNGIVGEYTKIDRKEKRADIVARRFILACWSRVIARRSLVRNTYEAHCLKVDRATMLWEDAAGIACRQAERKLRAEKLDRQEIAMRNQRVQSRKWYEFWVPKSPYAQILPSRKLTIIISPPSEQWHLQVLQAGAPRQYFDKDGCYRIPADKVYQQANFNEEERRLLLAIQSRVNNLLRCTSWITGLAVSVDREGNHIFAKDHDDIYSKDYRVKCEESWSFGGLRTTNIAVRAVENEHINPRGYLRFCSFPGVLPTELSILSEAPSSSSAPSRFGTPDASRRPAQRGLESPDLRNRDGIASRGHETRSRGSMAVGLNTPKDSRRMTTDVRPRSRSDSRRDTRADSRNSSRRDSRRDTSRRVSSRGHRFRRYNRANGLKAATPVILTLNPSSIAHHIRTGYATARVLCDDDVRRGEFATHRSQRGRLLCPAAFARVRVEKPGEELPRFNDMCENVWDEILMERYSDDRFDPAVIKVQSIVRMIIAKRRVKKRREEVH